VIINQKIRQRAEGRDLMSANIPKHSDLPIQSGSVEISVIDWSLVEPYRFGSRTAEFLIADAAASMSAPSARPRPASAQ
jgi:hypothetical protein